MEISVMIVILLAMVRIVGVFNAGIRQDETSVEYFETPGGLSCRKCSPGHYMVSACTIRYGMSICDSCPEETYMPIANNKSDCKYCSICQITQIEVQPCSAVQDKVCGCEEGREWISIDGGQGKCRRIVTTEPHETTSPTPPTTSQPSSSVRPSHTEVHSTPTPCPKAEPENHSCSGLDIFGYIMIGVIIGILLTGCIVYFYRKQLVKLFCESRGDYNSVTFNTREIDKMDENA